MNTKEKLISQSKVIAKLLYNGDLGLTKAIRALTRIETRLLELELENDYNESLKDCQD